MLIEISYEKIVDRVDLSRFALKSVVLACLFVLEDFVFPLKPLVAKPFLHAVR